MLEMGRLLFGVGEVEVEGLAPWNSLWRKRGIAMARTMRIKCLELVRVANVFASGVWGSCRMGKIDGHLMGLSYRRASIESPQDDLHVTKVGLHPPH